jgi:hypothetical protein
MSRNPWREFRGEKGKKPSSRGWSYLWNLACKKLIDLSII